VGIPVRAAPVAYEGARGPLSARNGLETQIRIALGVDTARITRGASALALVVDVVAAVLDAIVQVTACPCTTAPVAPVTLALARVVVVDADVLDGSVSPP
jgi:hypothetical protein